MARPFAINPNVAKDLLEGKIEKAPQGNVNTGIKFIDKVGMMDTAWHAENMKRMGLGKSPKIDLSPMKVFLKFAWENR